MFELSEMLKRIKEEKKSQGLTNSALAEITKIPLGTLNKILSGDSKDPQISAIIKIANGLNVSADYLVFGKTCEKRTENCEDEGIVLYNQLDANDQAEIRGEMKHMLKSSKYNSNNIEVEIAKDLKILKNTPTPIKVK